MQAAALTKDVVWRLVILFGLALALTGLVIGNYYAPVLNVPAYIIDNSECVASYDFGSKVPFGNFTISLIMSANVTVNETIDANEYSPCGKDPCCHAVVEKHTQMTARLSIKTHELLFLKQGRIARGYIGIEAAIVIVSIVIAWFFLLLCFDVCALHDAHVAHVQMRDAELGHPMWFPSPAPETPRKHHRSKSRSKRHSKHTTKSSTKKAETDTDPAPSQGKDAIEMDAAGSFESAASHSSESLPDQQD